MRPLPALLAVAALAACASPGEEPVEGVLDLRMERVTDFETMVDDLATVPMVYVGESHEHPEHQALQLRIVDELSRRNPHLMVGMEMFQRPYQEVLDRWTAGELDEETFLREASWYSDGIGGNWSGWRYYGPILRLARDRRLRVVALNCERIVTQQINRHGLEGVPGWIRAKAPAEIDTSVKKHQKAIREFFHVHPGMDDVETRFRRFYEAQCTWDESMAESAVRALAASPHRDAAIVVLAGSMHVKDFYAIPERARRRNGLDYRTVLPMERDRFPEKDGLRAGPGRPADFVLFTGPAPGPRIVRLGVILRGGDATLKEVWDGPAKAAGLRPGDALRFVDDFAIRDQVDLRRALEFLVPGDRVRLRWTRDGAPMEGSAILPLPDPAAGIPRPAPAAPPAAPPAPTPPAPPAPPK